MKTLLVITLVFGSLVVSECSAQNGMTRSGNYWVPNQMIAPMPAQARQFYYRNYGRSHAGNAYGVVPNPSTRASNPHYGLRSPQFSNPNGNSLGSADRFGGTATYRGRSGRQIGSADRFGGTKTYRDQNGLRIGTADNFQGITTFRGQDGRRIGTSDTFGGTTTFRDRDGRPGISIDTFGN